MTDETPDAGPQRRLAEYGDVAPPVEREQKKCERCGGEPTGDANTSNPSRKCPPAPPHHHRSQFDDVEAVPDRVLCGRCASLEQYLTREYQRRRQQLGVTGVVAVFCQCHDRDEVDIQSVYGGADPDDISCTRCGSQQVVIETLPPTPDDYAEVTQ